MRRAIKTKTIASLPKTHSETWSNVSKVQSKRRVGLEHDVLVPPIGWVVDARLEPNGVTLAVVGI